MIVTETADLFSTLVLPGHLAIPNSNSFQVCAAHEECGDVQIPSRYGGGRQCV
jgi:hypothetical protein